ncbi:helix-turn-helix domain-containing protein [Hydrogenoanaerobacterium sp.]|uniref:helix-turn-helix domain-containing protein n=1 Tax=Hydrogenoanaerobacterium sp. TaxID=2953763 RepID=UPI00289C1793|nr:helix-turn-helix domain-containing protein [Hydrogenoanaerobacterium sp.]
MIIYDKLFEMLKANGYTTTRIRKEMLMGQRTLTAIKNGTGGINHQTIDNLCRALGCQPGDLMEYVPDEKES